MEFKTEKWSQIKELFQAALDVEPSSRRAFLEKESGSVELRNAVEELLNANVDASSFLQSRDAFAEDSPVDFAPDRLEPGTLLVDRFQMRRFISRGGGQAVLQGSEIVGGVEQGSCQSKAQPADVLHDRVDVLDVFLAGVGIVEAEVTQAAELLGDAEVQADRLGMADVQVAVGLGGKRACTRPPCLLVRLSSRMISRMKSVEVFGAELSVVMVAFP